jgi:hypothetical protein
MNVPVQQQHELANHVEVSSVVRAQWDISGSSGLLETAHTTILHVTATTRWEDVAAAVFIAVLAAVMMAVAKK